jgi:hypothetical protein
LIQRVEQTAYWKMPTELEDEGGCDGDQLIVEGVQNGNYHLVDRWMPQPDYIELCRHMLKLTGLDVDKQWDNYH